MYACWSFICLLRRNIHSNLFPINKKDLFTYLKVRVTKGADREVLPSTGSLNKYPQQPGLCQDLHLASDWLSSSLCGRLGSESSDRRSSSLPLSVYICISDLAGHQGHLGVLRLSPRPPVGANSTAAWPRSLPRLESWSAVTEVSLVSR